jgi:hypothetical protein
MRISFPEIELHSMAKEDLLIVSHAFASIAVADYNSALACYTRFLCQSSDVVTEKTVLWASACFEATRP